MSLVSRRFNKCTIIEHLQHAPFHSNCCSDNVSHQSTIKRLFIVFYSDSTFLQVVNVFMESSLISVYCYTMVRAISLHGHQN